MIIPTLFYAIRRRPIVGIAMTLLCSLSACATQPAEPVSGKTIQINTRLVGAQEDASVALSKDRGVIVWVSSNGKKQPENRGVYGRFINKKGVPEGSVFQVSESINASFVKPSVAINESGEFIVVWSEFKSDDNSWDIYARHYGSKGQPKDNVFRVNTHTQGSQNDPDIGIDKKGNFTVVWASYGEDGEGSGIYGQRYDSSGFEQEKPFVVNTETKGDQDSPSLAVGEAGNFVVVWECTVEGGDREEICGQKYGVNGLEEGAEFQLNTYTKNSQRSPAVAMNSNGDFVATWSSEGQTKGIDIYAQKYTFEGKHSPPFLVNTFTESNQLTPDVAIDEKGQFTIVWASFRQDSYYSHVYGQRFDAQAVPIETEFMVNDKEKKFSHQAPNLAINALGEYVVAWDSDHNPAMRKNPNRADIYAKGYFRP